ncbi:MAG: hypothetical protein Pg6C_04430 [Treponemataceae bacterium]|nr:MAG: hypothetical protein Pg6C_04430 [Treponemataceae bacterium]
MANRLLKEGVRYALAGVCFLAALSFGGCNRRTEGSSGKASPLVLYSNSLGEGRGDWIAEKSKAAGFEINLMPLGSGDLVNRALAEKNNPVADIVFGINVIDTGKLIKADLLYKFTPAWLNKIDPALADPNGLYYAIGVSPLLMYYNTNVFTPSTVAKDWVDLATNPAYKDKYVLLSLGGGTGRLIISSILIKYADPAGVYGVSAKGWDVMRQFIQNGHIQESGEDHFGMVAEGKPYGIGEIWLAGLLVNKKDRNVSNMDFVVPPEGIPYAMETIAIIKNGKNEARAKEWVDWFGTTEVQSEWAKRFGHPAGKGNVAAGGRGNAQALHSEKALFPGLQGFAGLDRRLLQQGRGQAVDVADKIADEFRGGVVVDFIGSPHLLDFPLVEDGDPVGKGQCLLLVVGDVEGGYPQVLLEPLEFPPQACPQFGVQVGEGLVQTEDLRLHDDGPGQGDPLLLAA